MYELQFELSSIWTVAATAARVFSLIAIFGEISAERAPVCERLAAALGTELLVLRVAPRADDRCRQRWESNKRRFKVRSRLHAGGVPLYDRFCTGELKAAHCVPRACDAIYRAHDLPVSGIRYAESGSGQTLVCATQQRPVRKRARNVRVGMGIRSSI